MLRRICSARCAQAVQHSLPLVYAVQRTKRGRLCKKTGCTEATSWRVEQLRDSFRSVAGLLTRAWGRFFRPWRCWRCRLLIRHCTLFCGAMPMLPTYTVHIVQFVRNCIFYMYVAICLTYSLSLMEGYCARWEIFVYKVLLRTGASPWTTCKGLFTLQTC